MIQSRLFHIVSMVPYVIIYGTNLQVIIFKRMLWLCITNSNHRE